MPRRALQRHTVTIALVALASIVLAGCSPVNQGAVTKDRATGRPALVLALCDGEAVEAVELEHRTTRGARVEEEDRVLWRIEARQPRRVTRVVVGEVPSGFVEVVSLPVSPLPPDMSIGAEMTGGSAAQHGHAFERDELRDGALLKQFGQATSEGELRRSARINCSNNPLLALGLPEWSTWALPAAAIAGVLGIALLVGRSRRRRRASRRPSVPAPISQP
jgi:hypothetical protein